MASPANSGAGEMRVGFFVVSGGEAVADVCLWAKKPGLERDESVFLTHLNSVLGPFDIGLFLNPFA